MQQLERYDKNTNAKYN